MPKDLLSIADLSYEEFDRLLTRGRQLKAGAQCQALRGKTVAMLFEKPSLRTRVSFDIAVHHLGGHPLYLGKDEVGLGQREPVADVARVLERYVQGVVARVFSHASLEELARAASVPVINALSDREHPCQALADLMTVQERRGKLGGLTFAYVGDGNNVAHSLALGCALAGASFVIASPSGYGLPGPLMERASKLARSPGAQVHACSEPAEAVRGADVVYTDVWTSMGQEAEAQQRRRVFAGFQVDGVLLGRAAPGALFMHPMPAHYGEEVAPGMLDHPQSVAYDQAENRLHIQKAILDLLLGP
ncbi:MAG: ornithine carbamoyltransferase [Chloroflexi bacterium]|nr:ornithine carbamoyltransferase [Chloroflexota bacterium]